MNNGQKAKEAGKGSLMEQIKCPRCGQRMYSGRMISGTRICRLFWYPKDLNPSTWRLMQHEFPFKKRGDVQSGMILYPRTSKFVYLPALNCPDCKLVLLDYDEKNVKEY